MIGLKTVTHNSRNLDYSTLRIAYIPSASVMDVCWSYQGSRTFHTVYCIQGDSDGINDLMVCLWSISLIPSFRGFKLIWRLVHVTLGNYLPPTPRLCNVVKSPLRSLGNIAAKLISQSHIALLHCNRIGDIINDRFNCFILFFFIH